MRVTISLFLVYIGVLVTFDLLDARNLLPHLGVATVEGAPPREMPAGVAEPEDAAIIDTRRMEAPATPQVTVRVYTSTGLALEAQRASLDVAAAAFTPASVEIVWKVCGLVPCDTSLSATELVVRMVQSRDNGRQRARQLGDALIDPQTRTGVLATVYVDRTLQLARHLQIDHGRLLGRAVAHEIGHLLLASTEHAASGLMREIWSREELLRNGGDDWVLHPLDAKAIHQRLATSRLDRPRPAS